jgi:hypothetical protein
MHLGPKLEGETPAPRIFNLASRKREARTSARMPVKHREIVSLKAFGDAAMTAKPSQRPANQPRGTGSWPSIGTCPKMSWKTVGDPPK